MTNLSKCRTKWVLMLGASKSPEHRHILDLAFGIYALESRGIKQEDIFIYVDGPDRAFIEGLLNLGSTNGAYKAKTTSAFFSDQAANDYEAVVIFVTGHGSINGIDAVTPITPHRLVQTLKSSPRLNCAIVYLGQCHAGIFNYLRAGRKSAPSNASQDAEIILIGATNLHESLSTPTSEKMNSPTPVPWAANLYLLHVFKWFMMPMDVDGDGRMTIMDSYKYAGATANGHNKAAKMWATREMHNLYQQICTAESANLSNPSPTSALHLAALKKKYEHCLTIGHVHQEGWILNSIPAQTIYI